MRNKFLEELKLAAFRKKKQASSFFFSQFALSLQTQKRGVMLEWLKRHAWKACIRQKRIGGSNPPLSALLRLFPGFRTGSPWQFTLSKLHFHSHHILQYRYPSAA